VLFDSRHRDISLGVLAIRTKAVGDARIRKQQDAFVKAYNQACDSINQRGLAAYADVLKKYCHVDDSIIGRLPKMEFQHAAQPRTADVERTKNVKWKTF
jgi:NitT/TauT family transport system substrate-binding protein